IQSSPTRRGINIYTRENAPVVAVNDGIVKRIGKNKKLGRFLILEDSYGNRFTYAHLGRVAEVYAAPKRKKLTAKDFRIVRPDDAEPTRAASKTTAKAKRVRSDREREREAGPVNTEDSRERLY